MKLIFSCKTGFEMSGAQNAECIYVGGVEGLVWSNPPPTCAPMAQPPPTMVPPEGSATPSTISPAATPTHPNTATDGNWDGGTVDTMCDSPGFFRIFSHCFTQLQVYLIKAINY